MQQRLNANVTKRYYLSMIDEFREGHEDSFNALYKEFYRPLRYFAFKIVDDEQEAEDIVTESMVKLWQSRTRFSDIQQIKSFLFTITQHAALNVLRNRQRQSDKKKLVAEVTESANTITFFDELVLTELISKIAAQVEKLPKAQREVLKLSYFEGLTTEEISDSLGMNPAAVYTNRKRALQSLRSYFKHLDPYFYLLISWLFIK